MSSEGRRDERVEAYAARVVDVERDRVGCGGI